MEQELENIKITKEQIELIRSLLSKAPKIQERYEDMCAGFFFLGCDFGQYCHSEDRREILNWIKRNFNRDKMGSVLEILERYVEKQESNCCDKCETINDLDSLFCKQCGNKINVVS